MITTHKKGKYDSEAGYTHLIESGKQLEIELSAINKKLLEVNIASKENGDLSKAIEIIAGQSGVDFPSEQVKSYIIKVKAITDNLKMFDNFHEKNSFFEVSKQIAKRRAERLDQWLLWRDKLIRWTIGVTAAVLMYSTFVYLSEKVEFIKVPVHDLVTTK